MPRRTRRGFTLVELLVVVAIAAMMAALLFPVLASSRERGQQTACLHNLKQIGQALGALATEWDGHHPWHGVSLLDGPYFAAAQVTVLYRYLTSPGVLTCPTNPHAWTPPVLGIPPEWQRVRVSYGVNWTSTREDFARARDPSRLIVMADSRLWWFISPGFVMRRTVRLYKTSLTPPLTEAQGFLNTHLGRVSFLFADSHARAMKVVDTFRPVDLWTGEVGNQRPELDDNLLPEYR